MKLSKEELRIQEIRIEAQKRRLATRDKLRKQFKTKNHGILLQY